LVNQRRRPSGFNLVVSATKSADGNDHNGGIEDFQGMVLFDMRSTIYASAVLGLKKYE
jgi:hypothetical protein